MRTPKKKNADKLKDLRTEELKDSELKNVKGGTPQPQGDRSLFPQPNPDRRSPQPLPD